jgi:CRP/FNR family transcriptional regulator, cyclic AMP receptor protein
VSDITNFLKQADIFYQLTPTQLEMIANLGEERSLPAKDLILEEGSNSKELYIIIQGEADVLVNPALVGGPSAQKNEVAIATMRRGQSFGEVALVDEGMRSATVRAGKKGVRLLVIPREKLLMLCDTYPQLGYRLMYNLAADLAMKVRNTDLRVRESLLHIYGSNK